MYPYNHGRAATLIRDNRVGVYGRVDGSRGMYTSVTCTRPIEFRVVPVSGVREIDRGGGRPGLSTLPADGNGGARTRRTGSNPSVHLEKMEETNRVSQARSARNRRVSVYTHFHKNGGEVDFRPPRTRRSAPVSELPLPDAEYSLLLRCIWFQPLGRDVHRVIALMNDRIKGATIRFRRPRRLFAPPRTRQRSNFPPAPSFYLFPRVSRHRPSARSVPVPVRRR